MASRIRIAIDCMGGDFGLRVSLPAAVKARSLFPDVDLTLVGDQAAIEPLLDGSERSQFTIIHAPQVVSMADKPSSVLRHKKQSSMRIAIDLLQQNKIDAVVSAGNTGALMAIGCYVLKTLPGIERPAICSAMPTARGHCHVLDLGANVDSSARHLHQFAVMGAALSAALDGIERPRIALLNIGAEDIKGNEQVKLAGKLIDADKQLNYVGPVEGDGIFSGSADVVVCDGFVGNVALKVCEGTAAHILAMIKAYSRKNILGFLSVLLATPLLKRMYKKLEPQQYNGASFLGLQGIIVKSHGNSSAEGFTLAIAQARAEVESNIIALMTRRLRVLSACD